MMDFLPSNFLGLLGEHKRRKIWEDQTRQLVHIPSGLLVNPLQQIRMRHKHHTILFSQPKDPLLVSHILQIVKPFIRMRSSRIRYLSKYLHLLPSLRSIRILLVPLQYKFLYINNNISHHYPLLFRRLLL